jgi:hypothetical protein
MYRSADTDPYQYVTDPQHIKQNVKSRSPKVIKTLPICDFLWLQIRIQSNPELDKGGSGSKKIVPESDAYERRVLQNGQVSIEQLGMDRIQVLWV